MRLGKTNGRRFEDSCSDLFLRCRRRRMTPRRYGEDRLTPKIASCRSCSQVYTRPCVTNKEARPAICISSCMRSCSTAPPNKGGPVESCYVRDGAPAVIHDYQMIWHHTTPCGCAAGNGPANLRYRLVSWTRRVTALHVGCAGG
jgi:hypothetical protein